MLKKWLVSELFRFASTLLRLVVSKVSSTFVLTFLYCLTLISVLLWLLLIQSRLDVVANL